MAVYPKRCWGNMVATHEVKSEPLPVTIMFRGVEHTFTFSMPYLIAIIDNPEQVPMKRSLTALDSTDLKEVQVKKANKARGTFFSR